MAQFEALLITLGCHYQELCLWSPEGILLASPCLMPGLEIQEMRETLCLQLYKYLARARHVTASYKSKLSTSDPLPVESDRSWKCYVLYFKVVLNVLCPSCPKPRRHIIRVYFIYDNLLFCLLGIQSQSLSLRSH